MRDKGEVFEQLMHLEYENKKLDFLTFINYIILSDIQKVR